MNNGRMPWVMFFIVLDQLYSMPLAVNESVADRCLAVDEFMKNNGYDWNMAIEEMDNEKLEIDLVIN